MTSVNSNRQPLGEERRPFWETVAALMLFACLGLVMFATAPTDGDFAWSDAPRHALNGIFMHDLLVAMPLDDLRGWAMGYYLKYPALTILFYPPLFSGALTVSYGLFGFSHEVAQGTVAFFHLLLGFAVFALARRWMAAGFAVGAGLMLAAAPEVGYWGRQVMLDIPAYAWLAFTALFFVRYLDLERPRDWYVTLGFYLLALYTKQTPLFVAGALLFGLLAARGRDVFRDKHLWAGAVLFAFCMIPLAIMHLKFGQVNTASLMGSARADASRLSLAAWSYYITILPRQLGWPTVALAVTFLVGAVLRPSWRLPGAHMVFLLSWFILGYLLFSFIMVREPRHDLMALLPFPLFAALALQRLTAGLKAGRALGPVLAVGVGIGTLSWSVIAHPVKYVKGYREAAQFVMQHAPGGGVVMFHGYRDGNFIFNIRAGNRPDLAVARSDKFLIRVAIERQRGVEDRGFTRERIEQLFKRHGIRYLVAQTGFWSDLPSFQALETLLQDESRFRIVRRIATEANFGHDDTELAIYEYLGELDTPPEPMSLEMVGIGERFEQTQQTTPPR